MLKNTSQKLTVFAFADAGHASLDAGEPVTGDAGNITCKVEQDDSGTRTPIGDTNPTETEAGKYDFNVTAAECNGDKLTWFPVSSTPGVQVIALPNDVVFTSPQSYANWGLALDNYSATRGLSGTALPSAAANAAGGLPVSVAGGLDLDTLLGRIDVLLSSRSSHTAANVWEHANRTLTAFTFSVTVGTNNDKTGYGLSASERTSLAAALEAAIINELDGTAVMQAIADLIADDMTTGDLSVQAIVSGVRSVILAGDSSPIIMSAGAISNVGTTGNLSNYDWATSGEVSSLDARVETLANDMATAFGNLDDISQSQVQTAAAAALAAYDPPTKAEVDAKIDAGVTVNDIVVAALAKFLTTNTGQSTAVTGSVAKISQGAAGGNVTVEDITNEALAKFANTDTGESVAVAGSVAKLSQGSGGSSGEGDRVVTIIVEDGSSNRVPNAPVNILDASGNPTTLKASTNSSGVVVFNLNDGNYQGLIGATAGFETHAAESFTVSGHGNQTLTLTPTSITPAVAPASVLVAYCVDGSGQPQEGVVVQLRMQKPPNGDTGNAYSHAIREQASVANGLVQFTVIRSATYDIRRQDGNGQWQEIVINDAATHVIDSLVN